jgi:23S rRNA (guanine2535-N1)-methyltransferase
MPYRFATEPQDYSVYASGHVFYSLPGHPSLPVRLASETFQRCLAIRRARRHTGPCCIYDPCCGGAYHLATLAYLHWKNIAELSASDVDTEAVSLADRNLSLLSREGLQQRRKEIAALLAAYGKESHRAALESADELQRQLCQYLPMHPIKTRVFRADATDARRLAAPMQGVPVDLVMTDLPHGRQVEWQLDRALDTAAAPAWHLLEALQTVLSPSSLVALIADKQQALAHAQYRRLDFFRLGKRQVVIFQLS